MTNTRNKVKDPDDVLDFFIDWQGDDAPFLAVGETISSSSWTVPSGITKDSSSFTNTVATIWVSGGTSGQSYTAVNRITTSAGRVKDDYLVIRVKTAGSG